MQFVQETGLKIGESLIKLGKITPHELSKTLETQINIKLLNGFKCKKGSYRIIKTTTPSSEPIFKINPMQVIYEAINKFYEDKNLFNRKKFKNGVVFKASDNFNDELNKLTFTTVKHFKLANNISENNKVGDIIKKSPLNKNETFKFLFFLEKAKLIEMEDSKINNSIENEKLSTDPFKDDTVLLTDDQIEEIKSELNNVTS